ncbi:MAG: hypothetical protein KF681_11720 [Bdellovibrionaceae bacterium]|nr:hypothetical protein [Pseudobdellovibrionaceae bacterium]
MENMTPSMRLLQTVRYSMEGGESVRMGLVAYLRLEPDSLSETVRQWLHLFERGASTEMFLQSLESPARRNLLLLLEKGLLGEPILQNLTLLGDELQEQGFAEIELFLARLPFRMMLPLLFLLFPAFLLLLLGPLLLKVVAGLA